MPEIFDNIENYLVDGLRYTLDVSNRADFCVGYFNLRGWKQVAENIEPWNGIEGNCCRLLVGMQKPPLEIIKEYFSTSDQLTIDNQKAAAIKKKLAQEFKEQITVGVPTDEDERGLRQLSSQIKAKKVIVKLFLRYPLHAKLYLCFRDDKINPIIGFIAVNTCDNGDCAKFFGLFYQLKIFVYLIHLYVLMQVVGSLGVVGFFHQCARLHFYLLFKKRF